MSKHTHDEVLERAYSTGPKTSIEAVLGLFSAHADPPSMDARSKHDLVIRAAKEHAAMLDALRELLSAGAKLVDVADYEIGTTQTFMDALEKYNAAKAKAIAALPRGTP